MHFNTEKVLVADYAFRIADLEDALRESVFVTGERETDYFLQEEKMAELYEKVLFYLFHYDFQKKKNFINIKPIKFKS